MYLITREIHFSYGHRLIDHHGKCAHLHGHNGRVLIEVSSEMLDHQDMVMDFEKIRDSVGVWIKECLDHRMILCRKDPLVLPLQQGGEDIVVIEENPTVEVLARLIFLEARKRRLPVSKVTLWETENSFASYHE